MVCVGGIGQCQQTRDKSLACLGILAECENLLELIYNYHDRCIIRKRGTIPSR